ncbi:hypothetical protein Tco_0312416 [Tanacetum coccineum]
MFSANTPYPKPQYSVSEDPILRIGQYSVFEDPILRTIFGFPPYSFNYPTRRLTIEEMLAKFIDEVKEVTTRGRKVTHSKEIYETEIDKNEPPRFEQEVQEKPHDDGVEINLRVFLKGLLNYWCLAVLLNKLPLKEKDPRSFTIPCQAEDLAANHLSRFENSHMEVLIEREIADKFSDEHLMVLKSKFNNDEPWAIEITDKDVFSFKVNGKRLKKYYGGNIYKEDDEVIEFENDVIRGRRESNLKTLIKTKVLRGRQFRMLFLIFIESVFPDSRYSVSNPMEYGILSF